MPVGTGTIDFGTTPADEASVTISGQTGLIATSHIEAWFHFGNNDTTVDNGIEEHEEAAAMCPLVCQWTVDGSFLVTAQPLSVGGTGLFKFHYAWSN